MTTILSSIANPFDHFMSTRIFMFITNEIFI